MALNVLTVVVMVLAFHTSMIQGEDGCQNCPGNCQAVPNDSGVEWRCLDSSETTTQQKCPPTCRLYCKYGMEHGDNGCPLCACRIDPCLQSNMTCPQGQKCVVKGMDECRGPMCSNLYTACENVCPPVRCRNNCVMGRKLDHAGCEQCECNNPCADITCAEDEICRICTGPHCTEVCRCEKKNAHLCPSVNCRKLCPFGRNFDNNGCEMCTCAQNPCFEMNCAEGTTCDVLEKHCDSGVCYEAVCVNDTNTVQCPEFQCEFECATGYAVNEMGCPECRCQDNSGEVDMCNDPNHFPCPAGSRCEMRELPCDNPPCFKVPECVAIDKCPPNMCRMYCPSGKMLDENGCDTCRCKASCEHTICAEDEECHVIGDINVCLRVDQPTTTTPRPVTTTGAQNNAKCPQPQAPSTDRRCDGPGPLTFYGQCSGDQLCCQSTTPFVYVCKDPETDQSSPTTYDCLVKKFFARMGYVSGRISDDCP